MKNVVTLSLLVILSLAVIAGVANNLALTKLNLELKEQLVAQKKEKNHDEQAGGRDESVDPGLVLSVKGAPSSTMEGYELKQYCHAGTLLEVSGSDYVRERICSKGVSTFVLVHPSGEKRELGKIPHWGDEHVFAKDFILFERNGKQYVAITTSGSIEISEFFGVFETKDIYLADLSNIDELRRLKAYEPSIVFDLKMSKQAELDRILVNGMLAMINQEICEGMCSGESFVVLDLVNDKLVVSKQQSGPDGSDDITGYNHWENLRYVTSTKAFQADLIGSHGSITVTLKP